jgi:hypothetical protein
VLNIVIIFPEKLEKPASPSPPTGRPLYSAPRAWAASSSTKTSRARAACTSGSMSHGNPYMWIGTIARVRGPIAAAAASGAMLAVAASASTNTGVAPSLTTAESTPMYALAAMTTSSPGPTPSASSVSIVTDVPELAVTP